MVCSVNEDDVLGRLRRYRFSRTPLTSPGTHMHPRRYLPAVAALLGSILSAYACSGAVMSGSFATAAADPAAAAYWARAAAWYQAASVAFLAVAAVGAGVLVRRAIRRSATAAVAGMLAAVAACGSTPPDKPVQGAAGEQPAVTRPASDSLASSAPAPANAAPHAPPSSRVDTTLFGTMRLVLEDTTLTLSSGRTRTTTSLLEHVNSSADYKHTLLDAQRSGDGWIYLLIRTTGASRPHTPTGFCGAGEETDLVWAAVDPALRVARAQAALVASCLRTRDPLGDSIELTREPWSITSYIPGDSLRTVSFDRRRPDRGLRTVTVADTARP